VSDDPHTGDELIDEAEGAEQQEGASDDARRANLLDLRRIIAGLFALYGVVLFVLGLGASDADLRRAHGVNVNLTVGIALVVIAAFFLAWALLRPLGRELAEAEQRASGEQT
jgi:hypothetical protein